MRERTSQVRQLVGSSSVACVAASAAPARSPSASRMSASWSAGVAANGSMFAAVLACSSAPSRSAACDQVLALAQGARPGIGDQHRDQAPAATVSAMAGFDRTNRPARTRPEATRSLGSADDKSIRLRTTIGPAIPAASRRNVHGRTASSQTQSIAAAKLNAAQAAAAAASRARFSSDARSDLRTATHEDPAHEPDDEKEPDDSELSQRLQVEGVRVTNEILGSSRFEPTRTRTFRGRSPSRARSGPRRWPLARPDICRSHPSSQNEPRRRSRQSGSPAA